jgi:hypothetical protein
MLDMERDKLVAAFEKSAEDWPWRERKLVTMTCTVEEGLADLIESLGFDNPLKRGLLLVLMLSRQLRTVGEFPESREDSSAEGDGEQNETPSE